MLNIYVFIKPNNLHVDHATWMICFLALKGLNTTIWQYTPKSNMITFGWESVCLNLSDSLSSTAECRWSDETKSYNCTSSRSRVKAVSDPQSSSASRFRQAPVPVASTGSSNEAPTKLQQRQQHASLVAATQNPAPVRASNFGVGRVAVATNMYTPRATRSSARVAGVGVRPSHFWKRSSYSVA